MRDIQIGFNWLLWTR